MMQTGTVYKKGGVWYLRYSDFRVEDGQLQQLGAVADMTKQQARTEAKNFLAKINAPTLTPETAVTFTALSSRFTSRALNSGHARQRSVGTRRYGEN